MWADNIGSLTIQYSAADQIKAYGAYDSTLSAYVSSIEKIVFDNDTIWNLATGLPLTDTDDGHQIYGSPYADRSYCQMWCMENQAATESVLDFV